MPSFTDELMLDPVALRELAFVARSVDCLPQIVSAAAEVSPGEGFASIADHATQKTGFPAEDVKRILATLQNLLRLQTRMHVTSEELLDLIADAFERKSDEEDGRENINLWKAAKSAILVVLEGIGPDYPLQVARKAERLAYAHQNILIEARIITDLRPVFDDSGDKILQGIIVNTLLLEYIDGGQSRRLEVGLDATDVAELRRVCQRAEGKAVAMKEALKSLEWQTTIYPEEHAK